jgi:hypothetical protein
LHRYTTDDLTKLAKKPRIEERIAGLEGEDKVGGCTS